MSNPAPTLTSPFPSSVYGPVQSWRVGWSLGIDLLLETSTCSFDCVYCQLGRIQRHVRERRVYVPTERLAADFEASEWRRADVVTFSGNGEPTLAANLGECLRLVKARTDKPIVVLTNATLLEDPAVRQELAEADVVSCKLDAATDKVLQRMNRPVEGVTLASILRGIEALRREHPGRVALQCMFMPANLEDADALAGLVARLAPDEVQLNTPQRPYPLAWRVETRGNHTAKPAYEARPLRTIDAASAERIEARLRVLAPGVAITTFHHPG